MSSHNTSVHIFEFCFDAFREELELFFPLPTLAYRRYSVIPEPKVLLGEQDYASFTYAIGLSRNITRCPPCADSVKEAMTRLHAHGWPQLNMRLKTAFSLRIDRSSAASIACLSLFASRRPESSWSTLTTSSVASCSSLRWNRA